MKSSTAVTFVIVILILQVISTALMWVLNVLSTETSSVFALLLASNLLAFLIVAQVYRDPRSLESASTTSAQPAASPPAAQPPPQGAPSSSPSSSPPPSPAPAPSSPPKQSAQAEVQQPSSSGGAPYGAALPKIIHIGIPIASFLVILVFATVVFLPSDRVPVPAESTLLFVPIYLLIVVILVFGSMYLFKRIMDTEESPAASAPRQERKASFGSGTISS